MQQITSYGEWLEALETELQVFVMFSQPTCVPCRKMTGMLEMLEEEHPETKFLKVDITHIPDLIEEFGIQTTPFLLVTKEKGIVTAAGLKGRDYIKNMLTS